MLDTIYSKPVWHLMVYEVVKVVYKIIEASQTITVSVTGQTVSAYAAATSAKALPANTHLLSLSRAHTTCKILEISG